MDYKEINDYIDEQAASCSKQDHEDQVLCKQCVKVMIDKAMTDTEDELIEVLRKALKGICYRKYDYVPFDSHETCNECGQLKAAHAGLI